MLCIFISLMLINAVVHETAMTIQYGEKIAPPRRTK